MSPEVIEAGYRRSYDRFYRCGSILRSAATKPDLFSTLRHTACVGAWKKLVPLWSILIRLRRLNVAAPLLERVLVAGRNADGRSVGAAQEPIAH